MLEWDDCNWDLVDGAVQRLEKAWQSVPTAPLSQFVPPPEDPQREQVLVTLIKVDQEYRWRPRRGTISSYRVD